MIFKTRKARYITLGNTLQDGHEAMLARTLLAVLPPVKPQTAFVTLLEQELRQAAQQQANATRSLNTLANAMGIVGGGALSIVGGVLLWRHWQHQRDRKAPPKPVLA